MFRSDDPVRDFLMQDKEQAEREKRLPVCEECKSRIQDDFYWEIDGEILCEDCMNLRYRNYTEDYIKD